MKTAVALVVLGLGLTGAARAQQSEASPRPAGETSARYLRGDEIDYRDVTGPPPAPGSLADRLDVAQVLDLQAHASPERYAQAQADALALFPRFSQTLGVPLDRVHLPHTIQLLYGATRDAAHVSSAGKRGWGRLRPYQRLALGRVCGLTPVPPPAAADPGRRSSYPSGHTTVGWTTALVLAQIAPERRADLLERARDYGLSRIVCAAHFPTDVEAGRAVAVATVERLLDDPAFRRDLACARAEYRKAAGANDHVSDACTLAAAG